MLYNILTELVQDVINSNPTYTFIVIRLDSLIFIFIFNYIQIKLQ